MSSRLVIAIAAVVLALPAWSEAPSQSAKDQAQALVSIGLTKLHLARLSEAQADCDAALKLDPNPSAKDCLEQVAQSLVDQDLNSADAKLLAGDKKGAIPLAAKWAFAAAQPKQQARAKDILQRAQSIGVNGILKILLPDWLRQSLLTIATLAGLALVLLAVRKLWREWKRAEWYGNLTNTTRWSMCPLKESAAAPGQETGIATDAVLDALARVGLELQQPVWTPHLLLLRPTQPANYEPAIMSDFLSDVLECIVMLPAADDLCLEWKLHDVRLDDAVQNLQLKTSLGLDIGSVARFLMSLVKWFNAGEPAITGIAATAADKSVSIHLAAHGGRVQSAAVTAATGAAPGIDVTELTAGRVAFKFLYRMRYPEITNDQIDGLSALRQGAGLFAQYASTVPGVGDDAKGRTSSLAAAGFNLSYFRASIPVHCDADLAKEDRSSLKITAEIRQAALLAEGVAHALVGTEERRTCAIDCFRQLQDWPGSAETNPFRRQAAYNEAIVWAQSGNLARSVLMLTELLGERAPDTIAPGSDAALPLREAKISLPDAIRFPARVARVATFARYDRDAWDAVPESRVDLIANDAEKLILDLGAVCGRPGVSPHDHRLARYMYIETLRAAGHLELMRVVQTNASTLYESKRPTGLRHSSLDQQGSRRLHCAISYMRTCEELSPSSDLYCDMAESYLLLKEFTAAEGYARHAVLESNPPSERAYYIAAESFWLEGGARARELARKYVDDFKGAVTLEEFKALRAELAEAVGVSAAGAAG